MKHVELFKIILSLGFFTFLVKSDITPENNKGSLRYLWHTQKQLEGRIWEMFEDDNVDEGPHPARQFLINHGCYCFPNAWSTPGPRFNYRGVPLDELDNLCFNLMKAQRCLKKDFKKEFDGAPCNISESYQWYQTVNEETGFNQTICGKQDKGWYANRYPCRIKSCQLESQFVDQIHQLILSGYQKNWDFRLNDNNYTKLCSNTGFVEDFLIHSDVQCCGDIWTINRRPYDPFFKTCCPDGTIVKKDVSCG